MRGTTHMISFFRILAVIGPAVGAGVMLAIGLILGGYWQSLPPAEFIEWLVDHGWRLPPTIEAGMIPGMVGILAMLWLDRRDAARRRLWFGSAGCIAAVLVLTFVWLVPAEAAIVNGLVPFAEVAERRDVWLLMQNGRVVLALAASVLGMLAITVFAGGNKM